MRKLFIILAVISLFLGIGFTILPMGTLALLPISLSLIFALLAFAKSEKEKRTFAKWLLIVSLLALFVSVGKEVLVKDKVAKDQQFEVVKEVSKQEAIQELEELEELDELDELEGLE